MSQLSLPSSRRSLQPRPWPRRRPRRWTHDRDGTGVMALFAIIPSLPRAELARLTERMINRMNEIDGDPDLEDLREDDEDAHDQEQEEAHD